MKTLLITAAICAALVITAVQAKPDFWAPPSSQDALLAKQLHKAPAAFLLLQHEAGYPGMTDEAALSTAQSVRRLAYLCFVSEDGECPVEQVEKLKDAER